MASESDVDQIRHQLGLDQPALAQYGAYLGRLAHLDLGTSVRTGQPVVGELMARLPWTIELAATSIAVATIVGIAGGFAAALSHNRRLDTIISALVLFGISMPVYWFGLMLIVVFAIQLRWLPAARLAGARGLDSADHHALGVLGGAHRAHDAVRHARRVAHRLRAHGPRQGPGRTQRRVRPCPAQRPAPDRHGDRHQFGTLLGGAVLTETVFGWPGMGQLLVDALFARDYPVVQGIVLIFSALFILVNLGVDVLYGVIDPRIQYA